MHGEEKAEVVGRIGDLNESMEAYDKTIDLIPSSNTRELADYWMSKAEVLAISVSPHCQIRPYMDI